MSKAKPKRNRGIYVLREYEGLSYKEIAAKFRMSAGRCQQIVAEFNEPFYRPGFYRDPMPWRTSRDYAPQPPPPPPPPPRVLPPTLVRAARAARQFPDARMFWYTDDVDEA